MQLIRDIYAAKVGRGEPVFSLEFFPPKTPEGDRNLLEKVVPELIKASPDYCSVTYGAGGTTRDKTLWLVDRIQKDHRLPTLAHLTCVNHTQAELQAILDEARSIGVKNILALRGDPPGGATFQVTPGGFEFSHQLVSFVRETGGFSIGVAGFPEGHIACKAGRLTDWGYLKRKIDAGADFVITQLFFDNADYYAFRDHLHRQGVQIPIVPGIIPILSATQIQRFTSLCGSRIPAGLKAELDRIGTQDEEAVRFGIDYAARQCADLLRNGAPGIHFYTLNKAHSTVQVIRQLRGTP